MTTYKSLKSEVFCGLSMLIGFFTQLFLGPIFNFSALGGDLAWGIWFISLSIICFVIFGTLYGITFIGDKINKEKTAQILILCIRKMQEKFNRYVERVLGR
jgi:hypothetical protein